MRMWKCGSGCPVHIVLIALMWTACTFGQNYSVTKTIAGPEWDYLDRPSPKTYWGTWQPPINQLGIRYRFGVRPSLLTISLRCPIQITVQCDEDLAMGGKTLSLKVKAKPVDALDGKTFDSNFGAAFPSQAQYGFFSCDLIPDILPWRDLPVDMWSCVGMIPKYGSTVVSAVENVSVSMQSEEALPLGDTPAIYGDPRELISIDLKDFIADAEQAKNPEDWDIAQKTWNKIPSKVKKGVKLAIQAATTVNAETAENKAIAYVGKGFEVICSAGVLALEGHPSWKLTGQALKLQLRLRIPDRASSGTYPLTFTEPDEEQTIHFPISPYVSATDTLEIIVDSAAYGFKVEQCLKGHVIFSKAVDLEFGPDPKLADLTQAVRTYDEDEAATFVIPLQECTDTLTAFHGTGGRNAVQLWWSSPIVRTKGKLFYRKKNTGSWASQSENAFKIAHTCFVTRLQEETDYEFRLVAEDAVGNEYPPLGPITVATTNDAKVSFERDDLAHGELEISSRPAVTIRDTTATVKWKTNVNASTEVFFSPLNTFELYTSAVKHENDAVSISGISSVTGDRELVTNHNISIPNLEPGMTYYYAARSWTFEDDDPSKGGLLYVHAIGNFTTASLPEPPSVRIRVHSGGSPVGSVSVISQQSGDHPLMTWTTGVDGRTGAIPVEPGGSYTFEVVDHPCYKDKSLGASFSSSAHGAQSEKSLALTRRTRPPDGIVLGLDSNPIRGALIGIVGKNCTATSNASGEYVFDISALQNAGLSPGDTVKLAITKQGYLAYKNVVTAHVNPCGYLTADTCLLIPEIVPVTVKVQKIGDIAVSGASVRLEHSNTDIQLPKTNSQGISSVSIPYGSLTTTVPNALVKKCTLTVTPLQNSNLQTLVQQNIEMIAGENLELELYLEPIPAMHLEDLTTTNQRSGIKADVHFSEECRCSITYVKPNGDSIEKPWTTSAAEAFSWSIPEKTSGLYILTVKAQSVLGGEIHTFGPFEHLRWSEEDWNLSATPDTHDTVTMRWSRFPEVSTFSHYLLNIAGRSTPVTIGSRDVVKHIESNLQGLMPGRKQAVSIKAVGQEDTILAECTATFTAVSQSPVIEEFTIEPARVLAGQQVMVNALVTDPDSSVRKYIIKAQDKPAGFEEQLLSQTCNDNNLQIQHAFSLERAGKCEVILIVEDEFSRDAKEIKLEVLDIAVPKVAWKGKPASRVEATEVYPVVIGIEGDAKALAHSEVVVDWGDGSNQTCSAEMIKKNRMLLTLSHVYQQKDQFKLTVTPVFQDGTAYMAGNMLKQTVSVNVNPARVRLSGKGKTNRRIFSLDVEAGTFPIQQWTIDFGDGKDREGAGMPPQQIIHYYPPESEKSKASRKYIAALKVVDMEGTEVSDEMAVAVPPGSMELPPAHGEFQPTSGGRPKAEGDLSIACNLPSSARAGETIQITALVAERRKKAVFHTVVLLSLNGRQVDRKIIQIREGQATEIVFDVEAPPSAGRMEIQIQVVAPDGFVDTNSGNNVVKKTISAR